MTDEKPKVGIIGTGAGNVHALAAMAGKEPTPVAIRDPITAPPVLSGPHGRAWLCDEAAGLRELGVDPAENGSVAHWIVEAPWAHPCWHSYSILLLHLRPLPVRPRKTLFYLDNATHELIVRAMNPDGDRNKLLMNGIIKDHWLMPSNFSAQFVEISDELAIDRVKRAILQICDGNLSPDTDFQRDWIKLFGGNMIRNRPNRRPPIERFI